jgi:predicted N-acetyltransferase YhbS
MVENWAIRPERPEDADAVERLNDDGFGPGRYAKTAYRLREGVAAEAGLSFVAEGNGMLLGSVRFWPVRAGDDAALLLGPLAVHSSMRGKGIGLALMAKGIEAARATRYTAILLVGDEPYYARAGFKRVGGIAFPGPVDRARILGLTLTKEVSGRLTRAPIDEPVCADGAPLRR